VTWCPPGPISAIEAKSSYRIEKNMPVTLITGGQWGDEGKAKIIDHLAPSSDFVVRFQGGANAGHTVVVGEDRFAFHLVPSGILYPDVTCILGGGMVIDPNALVAEIKSIASRGIDVTGRVFVSSQAHVVLPYHVALDRGSEEKKGLDKIGTTQKGIAPAYVDKVARDGVRMSDLCMRPSDLTELLRQKIRRKNQALRAAGIRPLSPKKVIEDVLTARKTLLPMITDTRLILWEALEAGRSILCEGAQGALLDIDHGTYPYVTSSSATAGGAAIGAGLPPTSFDHVIGIFKAYCTRVGNGPFPTEDNGKAGRELRRIGNEFGTTTGRPRRCGWFDAVAARTVIKLNGITEIALTKLDVLDSFDRIKVCTSYKVGKNRLDYFPTNTALLERCKPQYEEIEGWRVATAGCGASSLPASALAYIGRLEELVRCRIALVSVGPERGAIYDMSGDGPIQAHPSGRDLDRVAP
jgi:adenylosuccinate synthase